MNAHEAALTVRCPVCGARRGADCQRIDKAQDAARPKAHAPRVSAAYRARRAARAKRKEARA